MKKFSFLLFGIVFQLFTQSNLIAQESLPNFKLMLSQGVPYDSIKSQTNAVINSMVVDSIVEGSELNEYQRWVNFWDTRAHSSGNSTNSLIAYKKALFDYYSNMNSCGNGNTPQWSFLGPTRINVKGTNIAKSVMGRVNAVAMHPSNLNVMYLGTSSSGIWKTTNAQDPEPNWVNISDGFGFDNFGVTDIQINPLNPDNIYVSTGYVSDGYGIGVLVSDNGGDSWAQTTLQYFDYHKWARYYVKQIRINPNDTNQIWAMMEDSVLKSTDHGVSWQSTGFQVTANNTNISLEDISLNLTNPNIVYVGGHEVWKKMEQVIGQG